MTDHDPLDLVSCAVCREFLTGPVSIRLTNDYLFRALLQQNNRVLKALICSLLHLTPASVTSAVVTNPIILGEACESKNFILDIHVLLNDYASINLEMQVINEHNWIERSLSYLCRAFDSLNHGDDYLAVRPAIQIGLLDFTLFKDEPEFYATYRLLNEKTHRLYSDKLRLSVLDLTQISLATEEDKRYGLNHWAALFKSTTWEELNMLAQTNEQFQEAAETVYKLSQEERIRQQCEAREDYYRRQNTLKRRMEQLTAEKNQLIFENESLSTDNARLRKILSEHGLDAE